MGKTDTAYLLGRYSDMLNQGIRIEPDEFARRHPNPDPEYPDLLKITWWFHNLQLVPKPMPAKARKRVIRRVLMPMLRRAAERLKQRVAEARQAEAVPLQERLDVLLVVLYLKGRSRAVGEAITGMIRLMKLLFIIQQRTGAFRRRLTGYEFIPGRFGPHSSEVYDDLQILIMAGLVTRTEFDENGLPVLRREDYGQLPESDFAGPNARYELTAEGRDFAAKLVRHLESRSAVLLEQLSAYKQQFARMRWQQIVAYIYQHYPEYTTSSELLQELKAQPDYD